MNTTEFSKNNPQQAARVSTSMTSDVPDLPSILETVTANWEDIPRKKTTNLVGRMDQDVASTVL